MDVKMSEKLKREGRKAEQMERKVRARLTPRQNTARPRTLVRGDRTYPCMPGIQNKERNTIDWKTPKPK